MKFENPIMNISMFEVENIVTESGQTPTEPKDSAAAVQDFINAQTEASGITITF